MSNISAKKIAILLPSLQVGGAERMVIEELSYLKNDPRFSFEVHLVFEKGYFYNSLVLLGIPVHVWGAPHQSVRMLKTYLDIIRYLRRTRCDILHSHLLDGIGPIVGKLAGARVVSTVHSDKQYGVAERISLGISDLVLGCGKEVLQNIRGFIPSEKVNVLSNAIHKPENPNFNRDDVLKQFGIKEGSKLVVSLGSLSWHKGFDVLIKVFRQVVENMPNAVLLIGGDGEEMNRLDELVKSEGIRAYIKLPGLIRDIHEVLEACDVYVNSSRREGLPMTLLEAIAHGKPIVATNVGGNSEVVYDGETGLLVPHENPERLADALIRMLTDENFRERAGNAALELFKQEYVIDKHCRILAGYYFQVIQNKSSR
jgi:glycosyltransferase involved in cell wall biosynthesis